MTATERGNSDLDLFTEAELSQMHLDTYRRGLAHFERADLILGQMAGLPTWDTKYADLKANLRLAMEAGTEAHELLRAIGMKLGERLAATDG